MKVFVKNTGSCDLNFQHILIEEYVKSQSTEVVDPEEADVIIFLGACSCSAHYMALSIKEMSEVLARKNPDAKVYMLGCLSKDFLVEDDYLSSVKDWINQNIDFVIPHSNPFLLLETLFPGRFEEAVNTFGYNSIYKNGIEDLYISGGCNNHCTFCKTCYQNFPLQSADLEFLIAAIDLIAKRGCKELNIIGTNISQFGLDTYSEYLLPELIEYIEKKEGIERVVLMGFAFKDAIEQGFHEVLRNSKKVIGFLGSIESGSDRILKLMNKGFTQEELLAFWSYINELYPKRLATNIISGFPTEDYDDIRATLKVLEIIRPIRTSICGYLDSPFVPSSKLEQLSVDEIKEHTRIYHKALTRMRLKNIITDTNYKQNGKF